MSMSRKRIKSETHSCVIQGNEGEVGAGVCLRFFLLFSDPSALYSDFSGSSLRVNLLKWFKQGLETQFSRDDR